MGGADGITVHLREDRRHIQERDVRILSETVTAKLNLELACDDGVLKIAELLKPAQATLVPEKREEVTTEGGLDLTSNPERIAKAVGRLRDAGIFVSLFLDPDPKQIAAAAGMQVDAVELHTGQFAIESGTHRDREYQLLCDASSQILDLGMTLHAGHGLTYHNVAPVAAIDGMHELNIGHSIVARALLVGMEKAVREMKNLVRDKP